MKLVFVVLPILLMQAACNYDRKAEAFSATSTVTAHFSIINTEIIQPKCVSCHQPGQHGPDLSTYDGVVKHLVAGRPDASEFYNQVQSGAMPVDRPMLSDDEILAIYQWIQSGAAND